MFLSLKYTLLLLNVLVNSSNSLCEWLRLLYYIQQRDKLSPICLGFASNESFVVWLFSSNLTNLSINSLMPLTNLLIAKSSLFGRIKDG